MAIDWEAVLAGPPAGPTSSGATLRPIGIPETFRPYVERREQSGPIGADQAERRGMLGGTAREPYYEGAEYSPATTMSPERRAEIQGLMAQAGLIKKNQTYRVGFWDETTSSAYKQLLSYANEAGTDADTALADLLSRPEMDGSGRLTGGLEQDPGRVTAVSSELDLEAQMQSVAERELGRKLKKSEISKFAALYQGMERSYASKASSMQDQAAETGQDFTVEQAPGADVAAEQFIESDPELAQEAAGQDAYGYLGVLEKMIGA